MFISVRKRFACSGLSRKIQCSFTPGVLKSLDVEPIANTRISYSKSRFGISSSPCSSFSSLSVIVLLSRSIDAKLPSWKSKL
ncbi:Uncharacterised protein [Vibrio cholerae]|nr:Uncharacterised protein [Vibrio cholerae]